jgi:hypothetical protein
MSAFQYEQLNVNRKTVRLLRVLPGRAYSTIECELHHADLDDKPNFVALSYTWDSGSGSKDIKRSGQFKKVGKNLWNFLYRFRQRSSMLGTLLWVDALCA